MAIKRIRIGRVPLAKVPEEGQWRYLQPWEKFRHGAFPCGAAGPLAWARWFMRCGRCAVQQVRHQNHSCLRRMYAPEGHF